MSYIVNAKNANPGQTLLVEKSVTKAHGVVVQSWPEIGVVVAHADRAAFRADVTRFAGNALESIGASRTVAVSEGTPAGLAAPWGRAPRDTRRTPRRRSTGMSPPGTRLPSPSTRARSSSGTCR